MHSNIPPQLEAIEQDTLELGFSMASDREFGPLLRTLAATKPGGHFLELGTGTGLSTAWLLDGMDKKAQLSSVDNDQAAVAIATKYLGSDSRIDLVLSDAGQLLDKIKGQSYDFIFADTWVGKFERLDETLALLNKGGLYVIDDLLPQPNWPEGHDIKVEHLMHTLYQKTQLNITWLPWSTGIMVCSTRA